jgi:hypothetical protein
LGAERSKDGKTGSLGGPIEELQLDRARERKLKQDHYVGMGKQPHEALSMIKAPISGNVFPETHSEIERLKAQIAQSELIVAAYEKKNPTTQQSESYRFPGVLRASILTLIESPNDIAQAIPCLTFGRLTY